MPDIEFDRPQILLHASAKAEQRAVLKALIPGLNLNVPSEVIDAVIRVQALWRRRCFELQAGGYGPAMTSKYQYMRNCPPAGVICRPVNGRIVRPCRTSACPWCWARLYVKRVWDTTYGLLTTLDSMYRRGRNLKTDPYPYKVVYQIASATYTDRYPAPVYEHLGYGLHRVDGKSFRRRTGAMGSAVLGTVVPVVEGWSARRRVLAIVPADKKVEGYKNIRLLTKRRLARVVAQVTEYPAGYMVGEPVAASQALVSKKFFRMLRFTGRMSGNSPHRPADPDNSGDSEIV